MNPSTHITHLSALHHGMLTYHQLLCPPLQHAHSPPISLLSFMACSSLISTVTPFVLTFLSLPLFLLPLFLLSCHSPTSIYLLPMSLLNFSMLHNLTSLALPQCIMLMGKSACDFFVKAPSAENIHELTLYGNQTFPSPLSQQDLHNIFSLMPSFMSAHSYCQLLFCTYTTPSLIQSNTPSTTYPKMSTSGWTILNSLHSTSTHQSHLAAWFYSEECAIMYLV